MVLVYSEQQSPRLTYILNHILSHTAGLSYKVTSSAEEARNAEVLINYSGDTSVPGIQVPPSGLLFENVIRRFEPRCLNNELHEVVFVNESGIQQPFDLFSACFYFLSRYEEYLSPKTDHHGRFLPDASFAYRNGIIDVPVVDRWIMQFLELLQSAYPQLLLSMPSFRVVSTVDLDNGYKYKGKGFKRTAGAAFRDIQKLRFRHFAERILTVCGFRKDEYDIYEWLINYHQEKQIPLVFFVLNARHSKYDRGLPQNGKAITRLGGYLKQRGTIIGIHPSYRSHKSEHSFDNELQGLQDIIGAPVRHSRQHYLKFALPDDYQRLIDKGITDDYSMGFASRVGFRAGTSRVFNFYHLRNEQETSLKIHPVTFMEGTFKDYLRMRPSKSINEIRKIIEVIRSVNGTLLPIWHEAQLTSHNPWKKVYLEMMNSVASEKIAVSA